MRLFDEGETPGVRYLAYGPAESTRDATYEDANVYLAQQRR